MRETALQAVIRETRSCALAMLENAAYIQRELPRVTLSDELRAEAEEVCSSLVGTKHDVISELSELDELLGSDPLASHVRSRVDRILHWIEDDLARLHRLVEALAAASKAETAYGLAYVLVTESAANILHAFHPARAAAEALGGQADEGGDA